jgi:DNA-binding transcriptional LysR family regulator
MGVSVLPGVAVEADVLAGRLVRIPWRSKFEAWTQIVWNERRAVAPAMAAFLEAARERIGRARCGATA